MTNKWKKYIEPIIEELGDMIDDVVDDMFEPEYPPIVAPRPEPKISPSFSHHYPDPLGDLFREIELPDIEQHQDEFIPAPPIIIDPLPGQRREGGKLIDMFEPEYPPIIIPRSEPKISPPPYTPPPDIPIYDLRPGEAFAQTSPFGDQQTPFGNRPFQPFQR